MPISSPSATRCPTTSALRSGPVDGYLGIYSERFGSTIPQDGVRYIASARQNVVRMANLIDDLLALSRAGRNSLHIGTVDCAAIAREVMADLLATEVGRKIDFVVGVMPPARPTRHSSGRSMTTSSQMRSSLPGRGTLPRSRWDRSKKMGRCSILSGTTASGST